MEMSQSTAKGLSLIEKMKGRRQVYENSGKTKNNGGKFLRNGGKKDMGGGGGGGRRMKRNTDVTYYDLVSSQQSVSNRS